MSVLRRAKLRTPDGIESIEYPLGVDAENVEVANRENLSQRLARIDEDLEKNEEDIAAVSELAGTNKQNIGANEIRIDALERKSASVDKKPYYFNTVADMKAYQGLIEGDMAVTLGYYEPNDDGGANYLIRNLIDSDYENANAIIINDYLVAELINTQINPKMFGAYGNGLIDDTLAFKKCFENEKNIIITHGKYIISDKIELRDNVNVVCEKNVVIEYDKNKILPSNARSGSLPMFVHLAKNFDDNNFIINQEGSFSWKGGCVNGNALYHLDEKQPNYWDSKDKEGTSAWDHDYQRAFLLCGYENVEIDNILIQDIFGHAIAHYGNINFKLTNSKIEQGIDDITHPLGGSRRDGCSGGSRIMYFENNIIFSDDDATAIVVGTNWGFGKSHVSRIYQNNMHYLTKNNHYVCRAVPIYCNDGNDYDERINNIVLKNLHGAIKYNILSSSSKKTIIDNILIENVNSEIIHPIPAFDLNSDINKLIINNSKIVFEDGNFNNGTFLKLEENCVINYLKSNLKIDFWLRDRLEFKTWLYMFQTLENSYIEKLIGNIDIYTSHKNCVVYLLRPYNVNSKKNISIDFELSMPETFSNNDLNYRLFPIYNDGLYNIDNYIVSLNSNTLYIPYSYELEDNFTFNSSIAERSGSINKPRMIKSNKIMYLLFGIVANNEISNNQDTKIGKIKIAGYEKFTPTNFNVIVDSSSQNGGSNGYGSIGSVLGFIKANGDIMISNRLSNVKYMIFTIPLYIL